ncbi:MAG: hypothetical protein BGO23_03735 [Solirubrobacterales bacterium 67-14]|nr:MAG: hypothetical protein BGO23_03735 [Solirubrobacterales bacterium 67-14]
MPFAPTQAVGGSSKRAICRRSMGFIQDRAAIASSSAPWSVASTSPWYLRGSRWLPSTAQTR